MKYLVLIHSNPLFAERWQALTEEQRSAFGPAHRRLTEELLDSGELVVAEGLADPATARRVTSGPDGVSIADGPFAEVKEHLAGFYLVDTTTEERALEIAARLPDAVWGLVEVRPVLERSAAST